MFGMVLLSSIRYLANTCSYTAVMVSLLVCPARKASLTSLIAGPRQRYVTSSSRSSRQRSRTIDCQLGSLHWCVQNKRDARRRLTCLSSRSSGRRNSLGLLHQGWSFSTCLACQLRARLHLHRREFREFEVVSAFRRLVANPASSLRSSASLDSFTAFASTRKTTRLPAAAASSPHDFPRLGSARLKPLLAHLICIRRQ